MKGIFFFIFVGICVFVMTSAMVWAQATAQISGTVRDQSGAALPGFRTYAQTGILLQVNSSPAINVVLEVGQITEQVEVQANAALVETRNATVGAVIENERILELP